MVPEFMSSDVDNSHMPKRSCKVLSLNRKVKTFLTRERKAEAYAEVAKSTIRTTRLSVKL